MISNNINTYNFIEEDDFIYGKFQPDDHPQFVKIDNFYCDKNSYMLQEAYDAFVSMAEAAKADSIELKIISATRNFEYQKEIWEKKWVGETLVDHMKLNKSHKNPIERARKILEYTAPPGFTRHHWGTDIDINSVEEEYFNTTEGAKVYAWLKNNAPKFGFCQIYTEQDSLRPSGFKEEKWHWSYIKIAHKIWVNQMDRYSENNLCNFKGYQSVRKLNFAKEYLSSINTCH
ncbi:MAG: M15 family metallopeptidase [Saprospiraceae bacterium]|nr:M15 family metallopeptidase [Saprospiraceae bacterium]MCC6843036.1 M15 family metallopeptidase [Saprospiraceae bacterium]